MGMSEIVALIVGQLMATFAVALGGYFSLGHERRLIQAQTQARVKEQETLLIRKQRLEHLRLQISKLYGPMAMLLTTNKFVHQKTLGKPLWEYARRDVLMPNNAKIAEIILSESYLLDEAHIPDNFIRFLEHHLIWTAYKDKPKEERAGYPTDQAGFPRRI